MGLFLLICATVDLMTTFTYLSNLSWIFNANVDENVQTTGYIRICKRILVKTFVEEIEPTLYEACEITVKQSRRVLIYYLFQNLVKYSPINP